MRVERLHDHPIISSGLHPSIGVNIQGPSLIRVPDWILDRARRLLPLFCRSQGKLHPARIWGSPDRASENLPARQPEESRFLTEPPEVSELP